MGVRIREAIKSLVGQGRAIPLDEFVALGENAFMQDDTEIYLRYQEAMALAVFLMQWHDGTYRDAFLDYVRDAYRGRIKGSAQAGRSSRPVVLDPRRPAPDVPQRSDAAPRTRIGCGPAKAGQCDPDRPEPLRQRASQANLGQPDSTRRRTASVP